MFKKTKLTLAVASLLCVVGLSAQTDDNYQYDEPAIDKIAITVPDQPTEPVQVAPPPFERDKVDTPRVRPMIGRPDVMIHGNNYIGGCDVGLRKVGNRLYCPPDNPDGGRTPPGYRWDPAASDPAQSSKPGAFVLIPPPPPRGGGGGSGGVGMGGFRGSDGNLYSSRDAVPGRDAPCSCSREIGRTAEGGGSSSEETASPGEGGDGGAGGYGSGDGGTNGGFGGGFGSGSFSFSGNSNSSSSDSNSSSSSSSD